MQLNERECSRMSENADERQIPGGAPGSSDRNCGRCFADFLKKVKNRSFLRKRLLLSASFSLAKRLQSRFWPFKLL